MSKNLKVGWLGEKYAEDFLKQNGYKILKKNFRSKRFGEIDLIALENDTLVFIEVKTRLTKEFGYPEEQVKFYKIQALKRAALYYKMKNPNTPEALRIDLVAIQLDPMTYEPLEISHLKNISE